MSQCQSFAPLIDNNSRVLILGSMPGRKSLDMQQYYAHPQNRFWRLLALLLQVPVPTDYADKQRLLLGSRLALWDTLAYCQREGSLDSDIKDEVPNDIPGLLQQHPQIKAVICNGGKAAAAFKKYFAKELPGQVQIFYLHSTSPANARMNLQALAAEWEILLDFI